MKSLRPPLIFSLLLCAFSLNAQQLTQYSQYLDNYYLLNPAATNVQNSVQAHLGFRNSWTGFPGSPQTLYFSAYAPLAKPEASQFMQSAMRLTDNLDTANLKSIYKARTNHITGLILTQDDLGLYRKTTAHLTYGFHLPLTSQLTVSVAPKLGWVNLSLNQDLVVLEKKDQPFINFLNQHQQQSMVDLGFGLWLYSSQFFLGYSLEQLVKNNALSSESIQGIEFEPHHFLMAGYRFRVSPRLKLVPNFLFRYVNADHTSFDLSMRAEYGTRLWASLSYRKQNAIIMLIGASVSRQFSFSYSYDNSFRQSLITAHEVSVRFSFLNHLHK